MRAHPALTAEHEASATRCAASSSARSCRTPPPGTRRASSRASSTARRPPRACSASAFPRSTAACRPTSSSASSAPRSSRAPASAACSRACSRTPSARRRSRAVGSDELKRACCRRPRRREDQRARDHRAGRRLGRRQPAHRARARRRRLRGQRREDLHHLGHARRLLHRGGAHRRARRRRRLAAADRARARRLHAHAAEARWAGGAPTPRSLHFDDVRVPAGNLIGEENAGFRAIMRNFNSERLGMAAGAVGFAQACLEEALDWARERKTFGRRLVDAPGDPPQAGRHADARARGARAALRHRLETRAGAARAAHHRAARDD